MTGYVVLAAVVAGAFVGGLVVVARRRATRAAMQPGPTPEEARIKTDLEQRVEFIREQDKQEAQEVMHADRDGLLGRLRSLVRGKK